MPKYNVEVELKYTLILFKTINIEVEAPDPERAELKAEEYEGQPDINYLDKFLDYAGANWDLESDDVETIPTGDTHLVVEDEDEPISE